MAASMSYAAGDNQPSGLGQSTILGSTAADHPNMVESSVQNSSHPNTIVASPTGTGPPWDQGWPSDGMADLHLSGSDPRMFPGVFTRGHRSGSFRNLAQAAEGVAVPDNVPEAHEK